MVTCTSQKLEWGSHLQSKDIIVHHLRRKLGDLVAGDHLCGKFAGHLTVSGSVYDGVFLCCPFSHELSWMGS